jgi:glutaredoxin
MKCPKCNNPIRCGCKSCRKRHGDLPDMDIVVENGFMCPYCGFGASADQWLDIEYEQMDKSKNDAQ